MSISSSSITPVGLLPWPFLPSPMRQSSMFDFAVNFPLLPHIFYYPVVTINCINLCCDGFPQLFFFFLISALFSDPLKVSPAASISLMSTLLFLRPILFSSFLHSVRPIVQPQFIQMKLRVTIAFLSIIVYGSEMMQIYCV